MTLIPPGGGRRRPTEQEVIALELVSGLLMVIGLLAFGYLFYAIATNDDIRESTQGPEIPGIGVEIRQVEDDSESGSYFEIRPPTGGQADLTGVRSGDRLVAIDGEDITGMSLEDVRARIEEDDVNLEDDDFEVELAFLRAKEDGTFSEETRTIPKTVAPTVMIAYLKSFGFVIPAILIALGALVFRVGVRLRQYDIVAARWALVAFLWLMIGMVVVSIWAFWVSGKGGLATDEPFDFGQGVLHAIPFLLAIIPLAAAYLWLSQVITEVFEGDESLTSRNTRFAWTLLVPTLVVLALVAARPLEQTFIKSLTDDEFGTHKPARFIGFDNYENLISFKLTTVECKKDSNGDCARSPNGTILWEKSDIEEQEGQKLRELKTRAEREKFVRYQEAHTWRIPSSDKGLRVLGKDPRFLQAFGNTLRFTISSVILELALGLLIALVVNSSFKGRGLMRAAMLVPWAIPTVVSAVLWQTMLRGDQTGIFNKLLMDLGIISHTKQWFSATGPWMNSIIAVDVWKTSPFMALLLLAGLQVIPKDLYEAASVDGASKVRQFFSITLPLLRPTIAVALIFRTLDALRAFDVFQVLLDSPRPSLASYNYDRLVLTRQDGYASAIGVMIFVIIFIFTVVYVRFVGIERE